jgi:hypothetical protein
MNEISKSRIELVKKYSKQYLDDPRVCALMVTGSVAKGYADDNSDTDSTVFYTEPVSKDEFEAIKRKAVDSGGGFYHGTPEEGFAVYEFNEGIKMDFGFQEAVKFEEMMNEYFAKPDLDNKDMMIICEGFSVCIPLKGEDWIQQWKNNIRKGITDDYYKELVKKHMRFYTKFDVKHMGAGRNDLFFLYEVLLDMQKNILGILFGLNKMYHPGKLKGVKYYIDKMDIKLNNVYEKFVNQFHIEPHAAVDEIYSMVYEAFDLIDKHLPEIDTKKKREILQMKLRR